MADRPRDDTWWIASDGKWYPPTLHPDPEAAPTSAVEHARSTERSSSIPVGLTRAVTAALAASTAMFAIAAVFGLRYGSALRSTTMSAGDVAATEEVFVGWSALALLALVMSGAVVLAWTFQTSKAFDHRGPTRRRWRGAWTIGSWFVPLASFVLPKLVFNELEKIAQIPFTGDDVGDDWTHQSRSTLGDLWWVLWLIGLFMVQATQIVMTEPSVDEETLALAASLSGAAHAALAGAGVAMFFLVRRIEVGSRS
ncbi:MAG: DUF4328 domain-containing protein [Actinomycetota bacterium]